MPVTLDPQAQNQPNGLLARVENTRRRISFLGEIPSEQQVQGFGSVISMEIQEAYRLALQREAAKFGIPLYGPLDPFVVSSLEHYAQTEARSIVNTYLRKQKAARDNGGDLRAWREHYASWKAPQVMQYEYARADSLGTAAFYAAHPNLRGRGRVLPLHVAVPDRCQPLVDRGWMPIDEAIALIPEFPIHPGCPHHVFIEGPS